jgi:hypothetical protein
MMWDFDNEGRATFISKDDIPPLCLTNGQDLDPKPINQHN